MRIASAADSPREPGRHRHVAEPFASWLAPVASPAGWRRRGQRPADDRPLHGERSRAACARRARARPSRRARRHPDPPQERGAMAAEQPEGSCQQQAVRRPGRPGRDRRRADPKAMPLTPAPRRAVGELGARGADQRPRDARVQPPARPPADPPARRARRGATAAPQRRDRRRCRSRHVPGGARPRAGLAADRGSTVPLGG